MNAIALQFPPERRYYVLAAFGIVVVTLAGFSIDADLLFDMSSLSLLARLHGLVMFLWIALFLTQALLVARRRVDLHRRLGIFGAVLAALIVIVDSVTVVEALRLGGDHLPPHIDSGLFLAGSIELILVFGVLVGMGIALRRRPDYHKRLMLLATIPLLDAALARFISAYTQWTVDPSVVRDLLILACIGVDTLRCRRLHPVFVAGTVFILVSDQIAPWAAGTHAWANFTAWVAG